ncbi:MAG TPA: hypothetical protein PKM87_10145 [Methanolinea sp.]|jgi:hypothetical protein|nr:MAG: hypothetical protein A4E41_00191 [Methanoregulaceae archaeon PtaU1.Bin066]HNQ30467.1 hypothetical protein [Methanolinea sp.]
MKKIGIAVLALLILFSGMAMADDPVGATRQTQGITTVTHVVVYGTFTDSAEAVWVSSNQDLRNNPPLNNYSDELDANGDGIIDDPLTGDQAWTPEAQYTMSYSEQTLADNGYIEWDKTVSLDTGNKVANQDNFKATTQFDFVSFEDAFGRATFSESLMLDAASMGSDAGSRMLCPFSTGDNGYIPAFCNIVEMGSSFTGSQVSMVTQANERHVSASADAPAAMSYSVGLSGVGSAAAWINAHIMEGRTGGVFGTYTAPDGVTYEPGFWNYDTGSGSPDNGFMQGVDMVYKEKTTASGVIESFSKSMSYQSGMRRI